jgi:hypothetical protein
MKKSVITILLLSGIMAIYSCKDRQKKEDENKTTTSQPATEANSENSPSAETKTYVVTVLPDTVSLGKNKEAFIKIKDLKAIELSNPDGTSAGIELSYKIELTNKNAIGGSSVGLPTTDFRLTLDNGNKVAPSSIYVGAAPEVTQLSDIDKFIIPAGTKPVALNLFFDQTKASIKLEIK